MRPRTISIYPIASSKKERVIGFSVQGANLKLAVEKVTQKQITHHRPSELIGVLIEVYTKSAKTGDPDHFSASIALERDLELNSDFPFLEVVIYVRTNGGEPERFRGGIVRDIDLFQ